MKVWDWITQKDLDQEMARQFTELDEKRAAIEATGRYSTRYPFPVVLCLRCGGAVLDLDSHDRWHDSL